MILDNFPSFSYAFASFSLSVAKFVGLLIVARDYFFVSAAKYLSQNLLLHIDCSFNHAIFFFEAARVLELLIVKINIYAFLMYFNFN